MIDNDPETQGINTIRPTIASFAAFRKFPSKVQGRETQEELHRLPELKKKKTKGLGRLGLLQVEGWSAREELWRPAEGPP